MASSCLSSTLKHQASPGLQRMALSPSPVAGPRKGLPHRRQVPCSSTPISRDRRVFTSTHVLASASDVRMVGTSLSSVSSEKLCDGTLEIATVGGKSSGGSSRWTEEQTLRIWTPQGLRRAEAVEQGLPVVYLNDAQNLFKDEESFSGFSWRAAHTAQALIDSGDVDPFMIVGLDHANALRSYHYTPYAPGTGPGNIRTDSKDWPGGGVDDYLERVVEEVLPLFGQRDPDKLVFGGSSLGGICALRAAMRHPAVFGGVLAESPSLWIGEGRFLEEVRVHAGPLPARLVYNMGTREYTDRHEPTAENLAVDEMLTSMAEAAVLALRSKGMDEARLVAHVDAQQARHTEAAWASRLPAALRFLLPERPARLLRGPARALQAPPVPAGDELVAMVEAGAANELVFTWPRQAVAGTTATVYVNRMRSELLQSWPAIILKGGFNGWAHRERVYGAMELAGPRFRNRFAEWWRLQVEVPPGAHSMEFVLTDGEGAWDNNGGHNYTAAIAPAPGAPPPAAHKPVPPAAAAVAPPPAPTPAPAAVPEEPPSPERVVVRVLEGAMEGGAGVAAPQPGTLDWSSEDAAEFARACSTAGFCCRPFPLAPGQPGVVYVNRALSPLAHGGDLSVVGGFNGWQLGAFQAVLGPCDLPNLAGADWLAAEIAVPEKARQMNFCFSNAAGEWDNNEGENYLIPVEDPATRWPIPAEVAAVLDSEALGAVETRGQGLFFTVPELLVPGCPAAVYFNQHRSMHLHSSDVLFYGGFNSWSVGSMEKAMEPAPRLPEGWLTAKLNVPEDALDFSMAFSDTGKEVFDNNDDNDYVGAVAAKVARAARTIDEVSESYPFAGGRLEIVRLQPRPGASRRAKWKEERVVRVWTPPGYNAEHWRNSATGLPVLFMNDGKNLYEDWLAHQGVSWNAAHTAAALIESGALPPFMIVGIDSPGPFRSQSYLPWPPGGGKWGHRPDAERWPGGDVQPYMERVTQELIPLITSHWGGSADPRLRCFGGASFGGVCSLYAAMHFNEYFGSFLVESPSLWSKEGRFLSDMRTHKGTWGEKIFLGVGTREHSYNRDEWRDIDDLILGYAYEAKRILEEKGVRQHEGKLAFQVDEGAGHVEGAWGHRLHGSLQYLCGHWREVMESTRHA